MLRQGRTSVNNASMGPGTGLGRRAAAVPLWRRGRAGALFDAVRGLFRSLRCAANQAIRVSAKALGTAARRHALGMAPDLFRELFRRRGNERVLKSEENHVFGRDDVLDGEWLVPAGPGAFRTSREPDRALYVSQEHPITFAGSWLLADVKAIWPRSGSGSSPRTTWPGCSAATSSSCWPSPPAERLPTRIAEENPRGRVPRTARKVAHRNVATSPLP